MTAHRHLALASRRWLFMLALVALVVRALVPAGWMPVASANGVTLALCDGGSSAPAHHMAMPTKPGLPVEHHHGTPDHPCTFAVAATAIDAPGVVAPLPAPSAYRPSAPARTEGVAIGRGLAAPPPPPTGPPVFA